MVRYYSGGNHGDFEVLQIACGEVPRPRSLIYAQGSEPRYDDWDGDGRVEVRLVDASPYAGWNACEADSPQPELFLRIRNGKYEMAGDLMRARGAAVAAGLAGETRHWQEQVRRLHVLLGRENLGLPLPENDPVWENRPLQAWRNGAGVTIPAEVWGIMLDLIYSDRCQEAGAFARAVWPAGRPGVQEFIAEVTGQVLGSWFGARLPWAGEVAKLRAEARQEVAAMKARAQVPTLKVRIIERNMVDTFHASEWDYLPAWSRNGTALALVLKGKNNKLCWGVVSAEALAGDTDYIAGLQTLNTHGDSVGPAAWHPDGKRLTASVCVDDRWRLMEYDLPRRRSRLLEIPGNAFSPDYSPDGSRLAYVVKRVDRDSEAEELRIRIRDLKTGRERELEELVGCDASAPKWSPDGKRLAYTRTDEQRSEIRILSLEDGWNTPAWPPPAARFSGAQFDAAWSGDGRYLAFMVACQDNETFEGNHLIVVDQRDGRWTSLAMQEDGQFLFRGLAWCPTANQLLCRGGDGLILLTLRFEK